MALPNYSPEGTILLGCVPWDNSYSNVRLYSSLSEQYSDIASMMTVRTEDYVYIGRTKRLKVSIHADRLYHVNYCAYRNDSLTDGWIYCFVTNVEYINDQTTELTIETDIFQTYLYGVDWTVPPCFIERMTVPSESDKYLLTPETDIPLIYKVTAQTDRWFRPKGIAVMMSEYPHQNSTLGQTVINPSGYYGVPAKVNVWKGIPNGANIYYIDYDEDDVSQVESWLQSILTGLTKAGGIESVVTIFTVPDIEFTNPSQYYQSLQPDGETWVVNTEPPGYLGTGTNPNNPGRYQEILLAPNKGTTVDGYTPRNRKLFYWPYTYLDVTDGNGSNYQYRYELFENMGGSSYDQPRIYLKYELNPACEALVVPSSYMGAANLVEYGFPLKVGAVGGWSNNQFQSWLGQHGMSLAVNAATTAIGFIAGARLLGQSVKSAKLAGSMAPAVASEGGSGVNTAIAANAVEEAAALKTKAGMALGAATLGAANLGAQVADASRQPTVSRGNTDFSLMFEAGMQGVHMLRMQVISEYAEQIDQYFSMFGYAVNRVETVNLSSRAYWNYIKTIGAAARSYNVGSSSATPHTRGRGCPSDALALINSRLDGGCTFWHTTNSFGNYSLNNSIS